MVLIVIAGLLAWLVFAVERIAMDVSKLGPAVSKFSGDFTKFAQDLKAFLDTVNDPANQAVIDAAVASLGEFDAQVQELDALVNPAPPPPPPVG